MPSFRKGVETSAMLNIEFAVLDFIRQHLRTDFGDVVMPAISALGDRGMIWLCLAIILCALPPASKIWNYHVDRSYIKSHHMQHHAEAADCENAPIFCTFRH